MSLVKFNSNRWPWNYGLTDFIERNSAFNDNFFNLEKSLPAMNVKEHDNDFEIELASPGFDKKDFEKAVSSYYRSMGWDENGVPAQEKLAELDLSWLDAKISALL